VQKRYRRQRERRYEHWKRLLRRLGERVTATRKHLLVGLGALCITGGVIFLALALFSPAMRVAEIRIVRGDPRLDVEQVQGLLSPLFGKHLMLLSSYDVRGLLEDGMPDLHGVDVSKDYPSTLMVRVGLDPIVARLRIAGPEEVGSTTETGSLTDYLTDRGMYVSSPRAAPGGDLLMLTLVDWGARPIPGSVLVTPEVLERITLTEKHLQEQFGQAVLERTVFLRAQEYHLRTAQWTLWFDTQSPIEEQLQRYRIFLREIPHGEIRSYIDLRLKDRVVYK
jgi:hypothetical protein